MNTTEHSGDVFSFPLKIALKVIGKDEDNYRQFVIDTVVALIPNVDISQVVTRPSRGVNFLSVTLPVEIEDRQQMDRLYEQLGQDSRTRLIL